MEDRKLNSPLASPPATGRHSVVLPWLLVAVLVIAAGWLTWRAFFHRDSADVVGSAMLTFEKQNSLTVFSSRFEVVAESVDERGPMGVLDSRQAAIIPALVEYRVDLSHMDRDRLVWSADSQTLDVVLPPLKISRPNLDEAQARIFTEGAYVTRDAARDLGKNNSLQAERKATRFAQDPQVLALARNAAKEAIRQNLALPLSVAGFGDVKVRVRFDGEPAPAS